MNEMLRQWAGGICAGCMLAGAVQVLLPSSRHTAVIVCRKAVGNKYSCPVTDSVYTRAGPYCFVVPFICQRKDVFIDWYQAESVFRVHEFAGFSLGPVPVSFLHVVFQENHMSERLCETSVVSGSIFILHFQVRDGF